MFTNSAVKLKHVLFMNESFFLEMLVLFFGSNIPLYIEKNGVEKLCEVLKMELKKRNPLSPKFVLEKIKFMLRSHLCYLCRFARLYRIHINTVKLKRSNYFTVFMCSHTNMHKLIILLVSWEVVDCCRKFYKDTSKNIC